MTSFLVNKQDHAGKVYKPQERSDLGEPLGPVPDGAEGGRGGAEDARVLPGLGFGVPWVHQAGEIFPGRDRPCGGIFAKASRGGQGNLAGEAGGGVAAGILSGGRAGGVG